MLEFVKKENGDIDIRCSDGQRIGGLHIASWGKYRLGLTYLCEESNHLRQIADKLDELNGK